MQKNDFLTNDIFLIQLANQKEHDIYARITALNNNEEAIEQIEGKITSGSINIDGDSAIRRTCSLTLVNDNINMNDFYWGIKTKFKLEIGLYNYLKNEYSINNGYPKIMWFPQGLYLVTNFNISFTTNNCSISISGKDKMSLLNGDLGGQLFASIDFGTEETINEFMELLINPLSEGNSFKDLNKWGNKYYRKNNETINNEIIYKKDLINEPLYPEYVFIPNKNGGFYTYNKKNYYKVINNNPPLNTYRYEIYKLITNPIDLYDQKTSQDEPYAANKYYYKSTSSGDNNYFILDTNINSTPNRTYYKLTTLYQRYYNITKEKIPLEKIIREAIHVYAKEPYNNIIINNLDKYGLEKLVYKGDTNIYILYNVDADADEQLFISFNQIPTDDTINENLFNFYDFQTKEGDYIYYNENIDKYSMINSYGTTRYQLKKYEYGNDIGYRLTDLTYAGDLITNIGETLTSVLDKIKTMLGEFEYFYDLDGKFIFQKKKNYLQTSWSQLVTNDNNEFYIDFTNNKYSFQFFDNYLISALQNSPTLNNVKNDFTVWGKRKSSSGEDIAIHARYAIDKKPIYYQTLEKKIFYNLQENKPLLNLNNPIDQWLFNTNNTNICWWNFTKFIDFLNLLNIEIDMNQSVNTLLPIHGVTTADLNKYFPLCQNNTSSNDIRFISITKTSNNFYSVNKATQNGTYSISSYYNNHINDNSKQYYIYIPSTILINLVDWREIIYQMALDYFAGQGCSENNPVFLGKKNGENQYLTMPDRFLYEVGQRNKQYYPTGITGYEQYYTDLEGFWRQLYNPNYTPEIKYIDGGYDKSGRVWINKTENGYNVDYYFKTNDIIFNDSTDFTQFKNSEEYKKYGVYEYDSNKLYWNKAVFEDPESLNFWFDFLNSDEYTELGQFSVDKIGSRSITVNEDKATSIIFKEAPQVIFDDIEKNKEKLAAFTGYTLINTPQEYYSQYFSISSKTLSVKDKIDELLYQHTYCTENISITGIPIYHLQPNTRIYVQDDKTGIKGDYIINKITIPLTYNGTMSIQASKAPERLY